MLLAGCSPGPPGFGLTPAIAYIPTRDAPVCMVSRIVDGDTITLNCRTSDGNARLVGFDTPETYRPGCSAENRLGQRAKIYLEQQLRQAKVIDPTIRGKDKYGRVLVQLKLDGVDLADVMVSAGLAVRYNGAKRINWCAKLAAT